MPYGGFDDYYDKKLIVTVATTGGLHGKDANPNLPEEPEEIAEDVAACEEAGASIVHLHARDEDGNDTKSVDKFQQIRDEIDARCDDIIVNFTTGAPTARRSTRTGSRDRSSPGSLDDRRRSPEFWEGDGP